MLGLRYRHVAIVVLLALSSAPNVAYAGAASGDKQQGDNKPSWCKKDERGKFDADRMPKRFQATECDLTGAVIGRGSLSVAAPPPGSGVTMEAVGRDGVPGENVSLSFDGSTYTLDAAQTGTGSSNTSPTDCDDNTQGVGTDRKVRTPLNWALRASTVPSNVGVTNSLSAVSTGRNNLVYHNNTCGETRKPDAPVNAYVGGTAATGGFTITSNGVNCASANDSVNVIEWASVGSSGYLAVTCSWKDAGGTVTGFDVRFNASQPWTSAGAQNCTNNWSIQGVATHEWGHVYGLSHVDEASHGNLTMSTAINGPCQESEQTLGTGDMAHMFAKYGVM